MFMKSGNVESHSSNSFPEQLSEEILKSIEADLIFKTSTIFSFLSAYKTCLTDTL